MTRAVSPGTTYRLNSRVRTYDQGRTLVGGSPARLVRLATDAELYVEHQTLTVRDEATAKLADQLTERGLMDPDASTLPPGALSDLTVVVPVKDRPAGLHRLLAALSSCTILVVDDGSDDAAAIESVSRQHGAHLVRLDVNQGPAAARNHGLASVRTPYVAFIDSDVVVQEADLLLMLGHFADRRVAAVGPRVRGLATKSSWFTRFEASSSSFDFGPVPALVRPTTAVAWLPTACLIARVEDLNGFDADLHFGEDVDLIWQMTDRQHHVRYEPAAVAVHDTRSTVRAWLGRKLSYGTSAAGLAERHPGKAAPAQFTQPMAVAAVALLAQRRWSLPVAGAALGVTWTSARRATRSAEIATDLTILTARNTLEQTASLLVRHHWPLAAVLAIRSRRGRRALFCAALLDSIGSWSRTDTDLDLIRFAAAKRLDDAAYGAGVWLGALRARSLKSLLPAIKRG